MRSLVLRFYCLVILTELLGDVNEHSVVFRAVFKLR